jgi:nicotinamidase-related amidase
MLLAAHACQLVLVDYQQRLMPAIHGHAEVLANALRLARLAQGLAVPVWGTEQSPDKLGPNLPELRALCQRTLAKQAFDAAADESALGLRAALAPGLAAGRTQLVLAGCEAHVCLLQTALGLRERGHPVSVVADACGARQPASAALAMQRLRAAGITLVSTEMVGFEWLARADHPSFKAWQTMIR